MEQTKKCLKCKEFKLINKFNKCNAKKDGLHSYCKICNANYGKEWYRDNKEYSSNQMKEWYANHTKDIIERVNNYNKIKRIIDDNYRIRINMRNRIWFAVKKGKASQSILNILGCRMHKFQAWLNYQTSIEGLNRIEDILEIDHIIPVSIYDLTDYNKLCSAYCWENTRLTTSKTNMSKGNFVDFNLIQYYEQMIEAFEKMYRK